LKKLNLFYEKIKIETHNISIINFLKIILKNKYLLEYVYQCLRNIFLNLYMKFSLFVYKYILKNNFIQIHEISFSQKNENLIWKGRLFPFFIKQFIVNTNLMRLMHL